VKAEGAVVHRLRREVEELRLRDGGHAIGLAVCRKVAF
jgi:hypothetical protein